VVVVEDTFLVLVEESRNGILGDLMPAAVLDLVVHFVSSSVRTVGEGTDCQVEILEIVFGLVEKVLVVLNL
jgi:hypothetical protein